MQATRIIVWFVSDCKYLCNYRCKRGIALEDLESSQCAMLPWCKQLCINSISFYRVCATPASKCSDQDFSSAVPYGSFSAVSWVPSKQPLPLQLQRNLPSKIWEESHPRAFMTMPVTDVASQHFQGAVEALTVLSHSEPRLIRAARFPPVMG